MKAALLWGLLWGGLIGYGQTLKPPPPMALPELSEMDRLLSALLALESATAETGGVPPAVKAKKLVAGVEGHPALEWTATERSKSSAILKKFRADFDALQVKRTGKDEPTDEQVRDFYRARAALLDGTLEKLKKELSGQAWGDLGVISAKHLTGVAGPGGKP